MQGVGFRVQGLGFRIQGSGFRDQISGFRVLGSGFWVSPARRLSASPLHLRLNHSFMAHHFDQIFHFGPINFPGVFSSSATHPHTQSGCRERLPGEKDARPREEPSRFTRTGETESLYTYPGGCTLRIRGVGLMNEGALPEHHAREANVAVAD